MFIYILPILFLLLLIYSYVTGGLVRIGLSFMSLVSAVVVYFLLGVNVPGCSRFHSLPFGNCSYTDEIITINTIFYTLIIFILLVFLHNKSQKKDKKNT